MVTGYSTDCNGATGSQLPCCRFAQVLVKLELGREGEGVVGSGCEVHV